MVQELFGQGAAQIFGLLGAARFAAAGGAGAVGRDDEAVQKEFPLLFPGVGGDGHAAAASEGSEEGPFRGGGPFAGEVVQEGDEVPGLVTEAATLEALAAKLRVMIPELLEANHSLVGEPGSDLVFEIVGHRRERLALAS